MKLLSR